MSQKRSGTRVAVEIYLDALALYLREHPDAGPSQLMRDIPEVGDLRAWSGEAIKLYEKAVERSLRRGKEEPFDLERVKQKIQVAQEMLG